MGTLVGEVFETDTAETSSYNELEHQVLMKLNKLKALYPQLSPTAATPTPTSVNKSGHFRFERRSLPKFGGALRDYPTFKADWTTQVAPSYDVAAQLYELRGLVPESVKVNVEKFTTMEQFWTFMDAEFRNKTELVRDRLKYLKEYKHPKDLRSYAQRFHGMFARFNEVYSDMEKVGSLDLMNHPASLQEFMKLLPTPCGKRYLEYSEAEKVKGTLGLEIARSFMWRERQRQKAFQRLYGEDSGGVTSSSGNNSAPLPGRDKSKDQCKNCLKLGHHAKECPKKKPASKSHSGQQVAAKPKEACPFCKKKGKNEVHEYRPGTGSTRLSSCKLFRDTGAEERATFVDEIKGCALCLCWKGDHRASNCPATAKGQPFEACKESGCGKKHHRFLHGTQNAYVNHKSRNKSNKAANTESARPESAVVEVEASKELSDQPPTERELEVQEREGMNTMFLVQRVPVQGSSTREDALVFFDKGSNVSMIRDETANKLGLKGLPVKQKLVRSGADVMDWEH